MLVNSCCKIRFDRKDFLRPPSRPWKEKKKREREDESSQWRRCHKRLTISEQATMRTILPWDSRAFNQGRTTSSVRTEAPCSYHTDLPIIAAR